jgi:two-component system LytT family response regulator/two-component system response regulator LytT
VFTALVVDDEPLARDELKYLLSAHKECRVIGEAEDAEGALRQAAELQPDVVFLDIEMPGGSGNEVARFILDGPHPPLVIFATAYKEHAVQAFELGAADYVLKPFEDERLARTIARIESLRTHAGDWEETVARVAARLGQARPKLRKLPVAAKGEIRLLDYDEILYATARDGSVEVVTKAETYTFNGTMAELDARLSTDSFLRVHKSFMVNLNQVGGVLPWFKGTYWLVMADSKRTEVPVSKSQVKDLKALLGM